MRDRRSSLPRRRTGAPRRTFEPAELIATKLRALFQRRKGRDLFDLWLALTEIGIAPDDIVACFGLRNALAHGNERQLERLRQRGVMDTVSWARNRLPGLNRTAKALDRSMWDHVRETFGVRPW